MSKKDMNVVVDRRLQRGGWSNAFADRRYRQSRSTTVIPHLGSKSMLVWRTDEPSLNDKLRPTRKGLLDDEKIKPKTSQSLPSAASPLCTWKRMDIDVEPQTKQATDRSYRHTYGDSHNPPFEIEIKKDFPQIKQKPDVPNPLTIAADSAPEKPALPDVLVTKIYSKLHDERSTSQDKDCVYVIKNMRRTTPASKSVNLPTVIPLYNIHLVKSVSKVLTNELLTNPTEETSLSRLKRPMASERKYYSQISGNLLRSRKRLAYSSNRMFEGSETDSRAYRSAEVYNKLLALRHANKLNCAAEEQADSAPPTSSKLRHSHHRVTFKCDIKEDIKGDLSRKGTRPVSPPPELTQHVTSVKVSKRPTRHSQGNEHLARLK